MLFMAHVLRNEFAVLRTAAAAIAFNRLPMWKKNATVENTLRRPNFSNQTLESIRCKVRYWLELQWNVISNFWETKFHPTKKTPTCFAWRLNSASSTGVGGSGGPVHVQQRRGWNVLEKRNNSKEFGLQHLDCLWKLKSTLRFLLGWHLQKKRIGESTPFWYLFGAQRVFGGVLMKKTGSQNKL